MSIEIGIGTGEAATLASAIPFSPRWSAEVVGHLKRRLKP